MILLTETGAEAKRKARVSRKDKKKPTYRVNLPAYHADCDANYLRLRKLLPDLDSREQWRYRIPLGTMELSVLARARYTTDICLRVEVTEVGGERRWMAPPPVTVRLYHDARMAEVVAVDGRGPLGGNGFDYVYPNPRMQRVDERQQVNRFLGEWLGHCLANGRAEFELMLDGRRF